MKGFGLTDAWDTEEETEEKSRPFDIDIQNNQIVMVEGDELLRQKVQSVLGTNKGEWTLGEEEGIEFQNIMGKSVNEDIVRYEILKGLLQVDTSFVIEKIDTQMDIQRRKLTVTFTAKNENGNIVSGVKIWG